ncbi:isocitrate/isopropylmalate dehydrogenase [Thermanaerovibrio velox DSM 12556]|uniref:Isocitrate/isopropylmalate dehydrogenase n=1 Tax=Thermanaerovibrio velox DSM 12556 TaxID=926567 RepID=H0UPL1_9BACT|nr:isocitrate/isopropylmalate family dehydrogenase [Thermanaerovibrio velox]EHM09558.1 isocitrate/isopropylmalate dehydrogenase [Thermanaerovibrio velox DSM 12556]
MSRNVLKVKEPKERYKVCYMSGDDSGYDMMEGALLVLHAMDLPIDWVRADLGWCMWEKSVKKFGEGDPRCNTVPPETIEKIRECDATLMAAITSKAGVKGFKSAILQMRQLFDLYINLRPAKTLPALGSPLKGDPKIDLVLFRENTEDLYAAVEFHPLPKEMYDLHKGMERFKKCSDVAVSWRVFSKEGCERIIRAAFEYAKATGRTKVHCCNKANVIRETDGMMKRIFLEIAKEYEQYGIQGIEENADATAMWLIKNPQDYQVIVTSNVFGDILSDEASQLVGGLGFAPSGNIGENTAIFEPCSGSVPKYAHQYRVNPSAMLLTAKMMLEYLGMDEKAQKIEWAINEVLAENKPKTLTYDVLRDFRNDPDWEKNAASTIEMATAIAQKINPGFTGSTLEDAKAKAREMCDWNKTIGFED